VSVGAASGTGGRDQAGDGMVICRMRSAAVTREV
jgi:hypothetical protein